MLAVVTLRAVTLDKYRRQSQSCVPVSINCVPVSINPDHEDERRAASTCAGQGAVLWLTGLSSAGKTTLAAGVFDRLQASGHKVELLDGDLVRQRLSKGLGYSKEDRDENIRRIGFVAELLARNGVTVIVSAISPYRAVRAEVRRSIPGFVEVYVNAPLEVCENRDVKGLYRRARAGELHGFTGIDDPYEAPLQPEVECRTDRETVEESVEKILEHLKSRAGNALVPLPDGHGSERV